MPQSNVPNPVALCHGHGALLVAASGMLVAVHTGRRRGPTQDRAAGGERDAHGALPRHLHAVRPVDLHKARSLTTTTSATGRGRDYPTRTTQRDPECELTAPERVAVQALTSGDEFPQTLLGVYLGTARRTTAHHLVSSCSRPAVGMPTRFPTMLASVHHSPPPFVTCPNMTGAVAGEQPRTGMNETETETGGWAGL